jgi:hypothetical protein
MAALLAAVAQRVVHGAEQIIEPPPDLVERVETCRSL